MICSYDAKRSTNSRLFSSAVKSCFCQVPTTLLSLSSFRREGLVSLANFTKQVNKACGLPEQPPQPQPECQNVRGTGMLSTVWLMALKEAACWEPAAGEAVGLSLR